MGEGDKMSNEDNFENLVEAVYIHAYSREEALADGVLVDASKLARTYGYRVPVALTRAAWVQCVQWNPEWECPQDESGRLWDVLHMCSYGSRHAENDCDFLFSLFVVPAQEYEAEEVQLRALVTREGMDVVITIMLPEED
jgi:hypothetical protein